MLSVREVTTAYQGLVAIADVSIEVAKGEIVCVAGANGAGKSTLLKSVIGIAPPAAGTIALGGEVLARRPAAQIARAGVAYVPQGRGLFAGMSVAENLELGHLKRRSGTGKHWDACRRRGVASEQLPQLGSSPYERSRFVDRGA